MEDEGDRRRRGILLLTHPKNVNSRRPRRDEPQMVVQRFVHLIAEVRLLVLIVRYKTGNSAFNGFSQRRGEESRDKRLWCHTCLAMTPDIIVVPIDADGPVHSSLRI